jgi:MFS superfamily sulfate permease-like transporter
MDLSRWIPVLRWLPTYDRSWLRSDFVAGLTLAAYLLPAGLGDASLANLPPQAGLYACLFSGLVFWIFCSSRHTTITVTSAISLLVGALLAEIAGGDPTRFGALAAGTALLVAVIALSTRSHPATSTLKFALRPRSLPLRLSSHVQESPRSRPFYQSRAPQ